MNIVFPELKNSHIQGALTLYQQYQSTGYTNPLYPTSPLTPITPIPAQDLADACTKLTSHAASAMIAGIDYSSRDVILACRDHLDMAPIPQEFSSISKNDLATPASSINQNGSTTPISSITKTPSTPTTPPTYSTFSGLAVLQRDQQIFLLADMAACKHPTHEQLIEIVEQTITSAQKILPQVPRAALLSFSTFGSGGKDDTITLMQSTLQHFQPLTKTTQDSIFQPQSQSNTNQTTQNPSPTFFIDGEMQLDAALNPAIATKKSSEWTTHTPSNDTNFSPVAGQANVLIAPDLNSGNLLYKAFEQIGGFHAAGPILQGFAYPVSDLSRGSTPWDIFLTICALTLLA